MKIPCSVPILTLNSKWSLTDLLPLLQEIFEDVYIVDGNSTDGTLELARTLGVRVEKQFETDEPNQRITHFARMRFRSWDLAKYDWIFWIDADEISTPEQIEKIREAVAHNEEKFVHRFIRLARLPDGKIVKHALFYPEYVPRLWNKKSGATLVDRPVHEKFVLPPSVSFSDHEETFIAKWQSPEEMWKRQRSYIMMDTESVQPTWRMLLRWVYVYNLRSLIGQTYRAVRSSLIGIIRNEVSMPWTYNYYFLLYRIIVMIESTRAWKEKRIATAWDRFFYDAVREVLSDKCKVLDIGAGLRIDASRGNVEDPTRSWIKPLVAQADYKVMDPVDKYHPDIVGDIHSIPVGDESYDGVICLAVLEHVTKPWIAVSEMKRILKPGGILLGYVPFLSPYHAMPGYYGDYFRYTEDGIRSLLEDWVGVRVSAVRGPIETISHLLPGGMISSLFGKIVRWFDSKRRSSGKQVSGYYFVARKHLQQTS